MANVDRFSPPYKSKTSSVPQDYVVMVTGVDGVSLRGFTLTHAGNPYPGPRGWR